MNNTGDILIAFDFWGAGNMGDDLMVDGFLRALQQLFPGGLGEIKCLCAWDIASQRRRFPQWTWIDSKDGAAFQRALNEADTVIGFGGTPFQLTSGDWLLKHMVRIISGIKPETQLIFINVGAETEIASRADEFARVLRRINHCSVRDDFSHGVLSSLGAKGASEIRRGGDLANLSLPHLVKMVAAEKNYSLGLVLGCETLSQKDLDLTRSFLTDRKSKTRAAFITGDVRDLPTLEYHLYKQWTRNWFSPMRRILALQRPDYAAGSLADLVRPFAECEAVISSRYHGLLTAAWFGCRVAAIGRSSKVAALAKMLGVPLVIPPIKPGDLAALEKSAVFVARERLEELRQAALTGVPACLNAQPL